MLKKPYGKKTSMLIPATLVTVATLFSASVYAAGATAIDDTGSLSSGGSLTFSGAGQASSYSDNPSLNNSSWAHTGAWYTFQNQSVGDVSVSVLGDAGFAPGVSVWASGNAEFDGGSNSAEVSSAGFGTPHSFNSTGALGDFGTAWMADGTGGNMQETLGYAMTGPTHLNSVSPTGWGEDLVNGAHDVSLTNTFESGVTGSTSGNTASLAFDDLAAGWYTVYVGGTDASLGGGQYDLVISAVPEAETWAMLLAGLGLIGWRLRKQQNEPNMLPA